MSGENERRRRNDDSELPGIRGTSTDMETGVNGGTVPVTSPLLILLDGVLSRYEGRVAEAMHIILNEYKVIINDSINSNSTTTATKEATAEQICNGQTIDIQPTYAVVEETVDVTDYAQREIHTTAARAIHENGSSVHVPSAMRTQIDESSTSFIQYSRYGIESPCTSPVSLCIVINALLHHHPHLARIPSDHDGSLPLHFAASLGNVPAAIAIMKKYPQAATKPNQKGKIPLHYAAREGRVEMVKYFLRVCPETCSIATDKGKLAIHFAVGDGHLEITSALLHAYPKSAAISSHKGKLPLHFCARWGYMEIALLLVSIYPNAVKALDWEGSLPLHDAAREGEFQMAKFLMNQYPKSLQIANLRGEIPLFPAIRSSKIDLITLMIQAWPMSGKHVLRNVCADDHISSWHWNVIELLLRGAINNFHNCILLDNHEPPSFCLLDDMRPLNSESVSFSLEEKKARKKARKAATTEFALQRQQETDSVRNMFPDVASISSSHTERGHDESYIPVSMYPSVPQYLNNMNESSERFALTGTHPNPSFVWDVHQYHDTTQSPEKQSQVMIPPPPLNTSKTPLLSSSAKLPIVRCKSPVLELCDEQKTKAKRSRSTHYIASKQSLGHRTFIPIHAAFECKASYQVIERVLTDRPYDVHRSDEMDRNVLHFAVAHCHDRAIVELVLQPNNYILTSKTVRAMDQLTGRLPLHIAIANTADVRVIQALLHQYPTSGITQCRTPDEFYDKTPIHMATHYNCDESTVYELLRIDPSFVLRSQW